MVVINAVVCFSAEITFSSRRGSAFPHVTQQAGQHSELAPPMFYSVQQSGCLSPLHPLTPDHLLLSCPSCPYVALLGAVQPWPAPIFTWPSLQINSWAQQWANLSACLKSDDGKNSGNEQWWWLYNNVNFTYWHWIVYFKIMNWSQMKGGGSQNFGPELRQAGVFL